MIKKILICTFLFSAIAVSMSAEAPVRRPVKGGGSGGWKTEETPVFAEAPVRRPVKGGGSGGWKTEETPVLAEGVDHASWIRSQKFEATPTLLEEQMGPAGSGNGASASGQNKGRDRGRKNEGLVLAEAPVRRPVKGGGSGGWKSEEIPILAEASPQDLINAMYGSFKVRSNTGASLLEAQHNLRRFH